MHIPEPNSSMPELQEPMPPPINPPLAPPPSQQLTLPSAATEGFENIDDLTTFIDMSNIYPSQHSYSSNNQSLQYGLF